MLLALLKDSQFPFITGVIPYLILWITSALVNLNTLHFHCFLKNISCHVSNHMQIIAQPKATSILFLSLLLSCTQTYHSIFTEVNGVLLSLAKMYIHCLYGDSHGSSYKFPQLLPRRERNEPLASNGVPWIVLFFLIISLSAVSNFFESKLDYFRSCIKYFRWQGDYLVHWSNNLLVA